MIRGPPKLCPPGIQRIGVHGEADTGGSQNTDRTPHQEMGQGICSEMQICVSTHILKPGEIVIASSNGVTGEEGKRRNTKTDTSRRQERDAADQP